MDIIPPEIFNEILLNLKNLEPHKLYLLRCVNKTFKKTIDNLEENYDINYVKKNIRIQNILNKLFWSNHSISIFKWFFKNNIFLTENNITNLIINKRLDILNECLKYNYLLDIIFKDNYNFLKHFSSNKIVIDHSPLILAAQTDQIEIIKFLLNINILKNPYYHQIDILINECVKKKNIKIIKYLITEYYDYIQVKNEIITNIIKKLDNIEDFIFYLIQNKYIYILTNDIFFICIKKKYISVCKYIYNKFNSENIILNPEIHIHIIIKNNCIELLNYLFNLFPDIIHLLNDELNYIYSEQIMSKELFLNIYEKYYHQIYKDSDLIYNYLIHFDNLKEIIKMIDTGFVITKPSIQFCLDNDKKEILKYLIKLY